jgi:hypothetical protein
VFASHGELLLKAQMAQSATVATQYEIEHPVAVHPVGKQPWVAGHPAPASHWPVV